MRKEEKTKRTYERILAAAIVEFGTKNYDNASLTTLCCQNQISKGLVYHNFKNKDELYLKCVEKCFEKMTEYLKQREYRGENIQESLNNLLQMRQRFFEEYPHYCNIFFNTVLQPPKHLRAEIHVLRKKYEEFNLNCFEGLLRQIKLRDGISMEAALEYFTVYLEMFNGYFQNKLCENEDIHVLIEEHEVNLPEIIDIMLYGVAKENQ